MKDQPGMTTSITKLYCLVEYSYHNAATYEKGKWYARSILATSLTEAGIRSWFDEEYNHKKWEKRWREGPDWFPYRCMSIMETRIEQL